LALRRPTQEHTELEEELHESAHIDYDRVAIIANPSVPALYEDALVYETGTAVTSSGALSAYSGAKTGRSPLDKRVVKEESSEKDVWWGPVNKPMSPEVRPLFSNLPALARYSLLSHVPPLYCTPGLQQVQDLVCRASGTLTTSPSLSLLPISPMSACCHCIKPIPLAAFPAFSYSRSLFSPSNHVLRFGP